MEKESVHFWTLRRTEHKIDRNCAHKSESNSNHTSKPLVRLGGTLGVDSNTDGASDSNDRKLLSTATVHWGIADPRLVVVCVCVSRCDGQAASGPCSLFRTGWVRYFSSKKCMFTVSSSSTPV